MYEDMMGLGLAGVLDPVKEHGMDVAVLGVSAIAGAVAAKWVASQAKTQIDKMDSLKKASPYIASSLPILVGLGLASYGRSAFGAGMGKEALDGLAVGMIVVGGSQLIASFLPAAQQDLMPVKGLGAYQDFSITRYLQGAPSAIERLNGAPTAVERSDSLNGYSQVAATLF